MSTKVNYGPDKVRFIIPGKVDSRIHMQAEISVVQEVKGNGLHLVTNGVIELEVEERPAVAMTFWSRFYA